MLKKLHFETMTTGVITFKSCTSIQINILRKFFKRFHFRFFCFSYREEAEKFNYRFDMVLHTFELHWRVTNMVFMLPWYLLDLYFDEMGNGRFFGVSIITEKFSPGMHNRICHRYSYLSRLNAYRSSRDKQVEKYFSRKEFRTKQFPLYR